ncbi:predicted protein [Verticillium alfalfae VaMs.102]|uniref:Predicted protein n=2 Tax=Verticillium TaxID=1036719 RepID=C9SQH2_VERA1|nr:predicted protein [Verticillium alfalfae VaMs.102]EEY21097.1 predicted protein [Verticillium alfalfae VaMs.102]
MNQPRRDRPAKGIRQACDSCHAKKIRCIRAPGSTPKPCERCVREHIECVFSPALKTGRPKKEKPATTGHRENSNEPSTAPLKPVVFRAMTPITPSTTQASHDSVDATPRYPLVDTAAADDSYDVGQDQDQEDERTLEELLPNLRGTHDAQSVVLAKLERMSALQQQLLSKRRILTPLFSQRPPPGVALRSDTLHELLDVARKVSNMHVWLMMAAERFSWRNRIMHSMTDDTSCMMLVLPAMFVLDVFIETLRLVFPLPDEPSNAQLATQQMTAEDAQGMGLPDPSLIIYVSSLASDTALVDDLMSSRSEDECRNPVSEFVLVNMVKEQHDKQRHACDAVSATLPRKHSAPGAQELMAVLLAQYSAKLDLVRGEVSRVETIGEDTPMHHSAVGTVSSKS